MYANIVENDLIYSSIDPYRLSLAIWTDFRSLKIWNKYVWDILSMCHGPSTYFLSIKCPIERKQMFSSSSNSKWKVRPWQQLNSTFIYPTFLFYSTNWYVSSSSVIKTKLLLSVTKHHKKQQQFYFYIPLRRLIGLSIFKKSILISQNPKKK